MMKFIAGIVGLSILVLGFNAFQFKGEVSKVANDLGLTEIQAEAFEFCYWHATKFEESYDHPSKSDSEICGCVAKRLRIKEDLAPVLERSFSNYERFVKAEIRELEEEDYGGFVDKETADFLKDEMMERLQSGEVDGSLRTPILQFASSYTAAENSCNAN